VPVGTVPRPESSFWKLYQLWYSICRSRS
jgi:hypothetical protein